MFAVMICRDRSRLARQADEWRKARHVRDRFVITTPGCVALAVASDDLVLVDEEDELVIGSCALDPYRHGARSGEAAGRVVAAAVRRREPAALDELVGEFAAVVWHRAAGELTAIRDHAGMRSLFCVERGDAFLVSDTQEMLAGQSTLDEEYIASFVASRGVCVHRSIWSGVTPLPAASLLMRTGTKQSIQQFWVPRVPAVEPGGCDVTAAGREFRMLLEQSLRTHVEPAGGTWAHLSGGLDSSTVVAAAAHSARQGAGNGLGGTITFVDSDRSGDETVFSNAVVAQYALRNVVVQDEWPWRDDGEATPLFDEPSRDLPFYARDRRVANVLRAHGATTLLSGVGPDHLLPVTPAHIPDLFWRGHVREGAGELYRWAACRGESVWSGFVKHALYPIATRKLHPWWRQTRLEVSDWFTPSFLANHDLDHLIVEEQSTPGTARGALYEAATRQAVSRVAAGRSTWCVSPGIQVRHPYLHQPLMKFCVGLPYRLRTDIYQPKPVLRAAMRSVLPENIRQRRSKGGQLEPRICRAFASERAYLTRLLDRAVLADIGVIEPRRVLAAIDRAASGMLEAVSYLYTLLALEMWLATRSGR
jgi:asparagine synthase (glutamine-hydrolysing)